MTGLLEWVQIYLHLGNDGSEFAQLQIYQMLIRNMRIRDYTKVASENFTEEELEDEIINCLRNMRNNCLQSGSQTLFPHSVDDSEARTNTEVTQSSVAQPRTTAMKRMKRRIISHERQHSNSSDDSFDESEVNRNRAQHVKNRGPSLFELIRQRKAGNIKSNGDKSKNNESTPTTDPVDCASQPQENSDDRVVEPESLPPLEEVPTPKAKKTSPSFSDDIGSENDKRSKKTSPVSSTKSKSQSTVSQTKAEKSTVKVPTPKRLPTFEIMKTQENSFEMNNEEDSKAEKTEQSVTTKSLNSNKIPVTLPSDSSDSEEDELDNKKVVNIRKSKQTAPSSSDETDSEKEELLKSATQAKSALANTQSKFTRLGTSSPSRLSSSSSSSPER